MPRGIYVRKSFTDEHKKNMSISKKGNKNGCNGRGSPKSPRTSEHRSNIGKSNLGRDVWNNNSVVRTGKYRYITRNGLKKPESHWAWFDRYGYFPKKNQVIHHKNFDEGDNEIGNLELMTRSEHLSLHNKLTLKTKEKNRVKVNYREFKSEGNKCKTNIDL